MHTVAIIFDTENSYELDVLFSWDFRTIWYCRLRWILAAFGDDEIVCYQSRFDDMVRHEYFLVHIGDIAGIGDVENVQGADLAVRWGEHQVVFTLQGISVEREEESDCGEISVVDALCLETNEVVRPIDVADKSAYTYVPSIEE